MCGWETGRRFHYKTDESRLLFRFNLHTSKTHDFYQERSTFDKKHQWRKCKCIWAWRWLVTGVFGTLCLIGDNRTSDDDGSILITQLRPVPLLTLTIPQYVL